MKKTNKKMNVLLITVLLITAATGFAFAESVPAYIIITGTPSIDVEVSYTEPGSDTAVAADGILMTGAADDPVLSITGLKVKNNNAMGIILVEKLEMNTLDQPGWTIVNDRTDFTRLPADSKQFSIVTDSHDFSSGAYTTVREINPESEIKYEFTGKTGPVSAQLEKLQIANAVLTLSLK